MRKIKLTQGKFALVDNEDYKFLNQWKWYAAKRLSTYYAARSRKVHEIINNSESRQVYMHKLIMNTPNNMDTEHINRNGLDNRKSNLKILSHRENMFNMERNSRLIGAHKAGKYFMSKMQINGKNIYLGIFKTAEKAHEVYMKKLNEISNT
jgi:hypothetical protein